MVWTLLVSSSFFDLTFKVQFICLKVHMYSKFSSSQHQWLGVRVCRGVGGGCKTSNCSEHQELYSKFSFTVRLICQWPPGLASRPRQSPVATGWTFPGQHPHIGLPRMTAQRVGAACWREQRPCRQPTHATWSKRGMHTRGETVCSAVRHETDGLCTLCRVFFLPVATAQARKIWGDAKVMLRAGRQ